MMLMLMRSDRWICFSLGRPTSIPEPDANMPEPTNEVFLLSLVKLARLMSKCATRIYNQNHKSLLPLWNAGNEIRRELLQFAEQQRKDMHFGLVGDPNTGELGVCQTIISTSESSSRSTSPCHHSHPCQVRSRPGRCTDSFSVPPHPPLDVPAIPGAASQAETRNGIGAPRRRQPSYPSTMAGHGVRILPRRRPALDRLPSGGMRAEHILQGKSPEYSFPRPPFRQSSACRVSLGFLYCLACS